MPGSIFVVHGDVTELTADAIVIPTSTELRGKGGVFAAAERRPWGKAFRDWYQTKARSEMSDGLAWLPVSAEQCLLRGIVLAAAIDDVGLKESARVVTDAIGLAVSRLPTKERGRTLVAIPAIGTGEALAHEEAYTIARKQIEAARDAVAAHPMLDVAFVIYDPSTLRIYREARRAVSATPQLAQAPSTSALAAALKEGRCAIFVGSGCSAGAGFPTWYRLIQELADGLSEQLKADAKVTDYLDIAQRYRDAKMPLGDVITRRFEDKARLRAPTVAHLLLGSLTGDAVLTTNYDALIERTLHAQGRTHEVASSAEEIVNTGASECTSVVKLHGDARHPERVVLSTRDYRDFATERQAIATWLQALYINSTVLFVGYSISDDNLLDLSEKVADMVGRARRPSYALFFGAIDDDKAKTLRSHNIEPIEVAYAPGADLTIETARWLDAMLEASLAEPAPLLLPSLAAPNLSAHLDPLRGSLRALADNVAQATMKPLQRNEAIALVELVETLARLGWRRDARSSITHLLERLAEAFDEGSHERSRVLRSAERHAARVAKKE